uniref:Uncharacterized protein n=1 Tax=Rhizophora mucronata TaxID=61149 RepID=A0A2P2PHS1_RHIMU
MYFSLVCSCYMRVHLKTTYKHEPKLLWTII